VTLVTLRPGVVLAYCLGHALLQLAVVKGASLAEDQSDARADIESGSESTCNARARWSFHI